MVVRNPGGTTRQIADHEWMYGRCDASDTETPHQMNVLLFGLSAAEQRNCGTSTPKTSCFPPEFHISNEAASALHIDAPGISVCADETSNRYFIRFAADVIYLHAFDPNRIPSDAKPKPSN